MVRIVKILKPVKYGEGDAWVVVPVQLDHGGTSEVWVGGEIEEYFSHGKAKAYVKRRVDKK